MTIQSTENGSEKPISFETALTELESLVGELEDGNLGLDDSVDRFRKATDLAGYCRRLIAGARLRVTELQADDPDTADFDGVGDDIPS